MSDLILHCGAEHVKREDLYKLPVPTNTISHYPVPHYRLLDLVQESLGAFGLNVIKEEHGLTNDGSRYFGVLQLAGTNTDFATVCGVRNSHDKSFSQSLVFGASVFVCDNLSFMGMVKMSRKHTVNILRDLPGLAHRAVSKLESHYWQQNKQFDAYKNYELPEDRARYLMVEAVKKKVIGCTTLPKVLAEWEQPSHEEFADRNLWSFFNSVTEVGKEWSSENLVRRTQLLHGLCNQEVGIESLAV